VVVLQIAWAVAAPDSRWTDDAAAHHNRGVAHLANGRFRNAVQAFSAAARSMPEAAAPHLNIAVTHLRAGEPEEALASLEEAGSGPRALVLRARILDDLHRSDDARRAWSRALATDALDEPTLWHLAHRLHHQGRSEASLDVLERLGELGDPIGLVALERARLLAETGRESDALHTAQGAVERFGPSSEESERALAAASEALEREDAERARRQILVAANLLRADQAFRVEMQRITSKRPGSPLSDGPHPIPRSPGPGAEPAALSATALGVDAAEALGLCTGEHELILVGPRGTEIFTRDGESRWRRSERLELAGRDCLRADLDRDGVSDLIVVSESGVRVRWGASSPATVIAPATGVTLTDYDLDGDADLLLTGPSGTSLWRNNRDRSFSDRTSVSGLAPLVSGESLAAVPADLDRDGVSELYVARASGRLVCLDGLRTERARATGGAHCPEGTGPVALADFDADGDLDLVVADRFYTNRGDGRLGDGAPLPDLPPPAGLRRLGAVDVDSDGLPDLVAIHRTGITVLRSLGSGRFAAWESDWRGPADDVAVTDLDGDDSPELAVLAGGAVQSVESPGTRGGLVLDVRATKDNPESVGTRIDLLAGTLHLARELAISTTAVGEDRPALFLGLGRGPWGEWLQVTWTNDTWTAAEDPKPGRAELEQPRTLVGSCPYLFAWNGEAFELVTDLLGGSPLGLPADLERTMPFDPEEYVLIDGDRLRRRGDGYELRITEELREILYLDHAELLAVDHPADVVVATADGLRPPPFPELRLYAARAPRPPVTARDHRGEDVLARLTAIDGRFPDAFEPIPFQGFSELHGVDLEFDRIENRAAAFLLLTGGSYWSEAEGYAIAQARRVRPEPPRLQVWRNGGWRTILDPLPFPGGRSKTVAVDLQGRLEPGSGPVRLRIRTNLRLYFDRILLGSDLGESAAPRLRTLEPVAVDLRRRGYSRPAAFDGHLPPGALYHETSPARPWPRFEGYFTRYGDVASLLAEPDNLQAVLHHGDEIALTFRAPEEEPPPGWRRDFLLHLVGWDKDGDPKTAAGTTVHPLPFLGMSAYPYGPWERFPWTPELRRADAELRTRWISRD
jgi:tetratricopeptide (TPR) repeat protein